MRITAQDIYGLYAPSACDLRIWLRAKHEPEAEPGLFEQVLMRLGQRHEAAHLATFRQVTDVRSLEFEDRAGETRELVAKGVKVLYQPVLLFSTTIDGVVCEIVGEPDFLIRKDDSYIIRDVKLVRRVDEDNHPEVILQLQLYAWLYEKVFGPPPLRLEVFSGQSELVVVPYDEENVLRHLRKVVDLNTRNEVPYCPVGWSKCTGCGFHDRCWKEAMASNDVALVYGVDQGLAMQLHRQDVRTIDQLVKSFDESKLSRFQRPWGDRMQKVGTAAGAILRSAKALMTHTEIVLVRPAIPEHDNYVFFDLEGLPPQLDELGKTYLWGTRVFGKNEGDFQAAVAGFGENGDQQGWQCFLGIADAILQKHGDIPWVHWASYERTQLNEYIRRYGDPTGTAARVLRNLLDLLPIARNSVVLPVYSYSLKEIEKHVNFRRSQNQFGGAWSMAKFIEASESEDKALREQAMDQILVYNAEDLLATWAVFRWLREERIAVGSVKNVCKKS